MKYIALLGFISLAWCRPDPFELACDRAMGGLYVEHDHSCFIDRPDCLALFDRNRIWTQIGRSGCADSVQFVINAKEPK